jgi:hypothetical protein
MTGEPLNYVYSVFAFIGLILACIPFYWHLEREYATPDPLHLS